MRLNGDVGEPRTLDAGVEFVEFNVLGPVTVTRGSTAMNVGGPKQRAVLAVLIARRSRPVTADVIVDAVYGDGASSRHRRTVQSYVSTLRSELGDVIEKSGSGWTLTADPSAVDAHRFEQAIRTADELDPASASEALRNALASWRGLPYADVETHGLLDGEIARLNELRVAAQHARLDADLACGRDRDLVGEIEALVAEHPYLEGFRAQHMMALYRSGRQREALQSFQQMRTMLLDEVGVDPGPELQELEQRILDQDESLLPPPDRTIQRRSILVADPGDVRELALLSVPERERRLARAATAVRSAAVAAGAADVHPAGTATYVVFDTPSAAASAARSVAADLDGDRVRIAIDWGDIEVTDAGVSGPPVSRAATLVALAHPGQVVVSKEAQSAIVAAGPAPGQRFESLGGQDLPGIEGTTTVFQLLGDPPETFPPLTSDRLPPPLPEGGLRAVPGYELRESLGPGSVGTLYRSYQPTVGREVIVEVIPRSIAGETAFIHAFEADAQRLSLLDHPNVAPLLDYWRDSDGAYLVYRFHNGGRLSDGAVASRSVFAQVAAALAYAHSYGIVHGSVRPDRVMLDESGNARLFGFALAGVRPSSSTEHAAYIAPELLKGAVATPATDVYALGVMALEIEHGPIENDVAMGSARPEIARALDDDPGRRSSIAELAQSIAPSTSSAAGALTETRNPFKGLVAFHERDAGDFHGRSALLAEMVAGLTESSFLAVVGPSGIGKSSAVRAGLVPMLRGGAVPGSDRWVVTNMLPGSHPFVELRRAIERVAVDMPPSLGESLAAHRLDALADVDAALPGAAELLVVVDQFEELFTLTSEAEAAAFMRLLLHATEHGQARFVVTMRADFLDRPLLYSAFGELLGDHLLTVAAPTKDELTEAITRPPGALGVSVDGVLVDRIANDVHDRPGSLPLLQHAMTELFAARTTDRLEAASYEAIGGVAGSLARRAETTFAALESAEQHALHQALLRLVTVADDAAPTRRRVRLSELDNLGAGNGIEAFMRARLLVGDTDPDTRTPTVELAHEALIDHWPRLAGWIDDVRDDLTQSRRLDEAVVEWQASGEADDFLLTSGRLAQHTAWSDESMLTLTPTEHEYLRRSRRHDDDLRTRRRRRRSVVIGVLIALTVASSAFAAIAIRNGRMANEEARRARAEAFAQGAAAVLDRDPELAVMLGIQAVELNADSQSATRALNRAVQAHRTIYQPPAPPPDEERALSASISPDGELLAVSNWERLRVWEVGATDEPLWEWAGDDEEAVASVDFTVDGEHVVISNVLGDDQFCEQHTWRVLDARSGAEVASAVTPGLIPFDAGASQSGPYVDLDRPIVLASSGEIGSCFDLDSEVDLVAVGLLGGERDVIGLGANGAGERFIGVPTVDSSGARLATGGIGPGAVVDVATGEELLEIPPGMSTISPDGEQVIAGNDPLVLLDVETGATLREFQGEYRIAWFSPTGSMVYGGTLDGRLQVYDIETGRAIHTLSGSEADFRRVQMTDDESRIASIADDGTVRVWDIGSPIRGTAGPTEFRPDASGEEAVFFVTNTHVTSAGVLAARALTTGPATGEFGGAVQVPATTLYDLASGRELSTYPGLVVAVSADDRFVAYQETGPLVEHIEPGEDGDEDEAQQHVPYGRFQIADLATGRTVVELEGYCSWLRPAQFSGVDPVLDEQCREYPGPWPEFTYAGEFSPDGSLFASAGQSGRAAVWDTATGQMMWSRDSQFEEYEDQPFIQSQVAFSPDGRRLIASSRRTLSVLDVDDWTNVAEYENEIAISHIEFTPDGDHVVLGDWNIDVIVLETDRWTEIHRLSGQQGPWFPDIAIDPTGTYVATAGTDHDSRIWEIETGELAQLISVPPLTVGLRNVEWIDERTLYLGTRPLGVLMTLDPETLVETARSMLTRTWASEECTTYDIDPCPTLDEIRGSA